MGSQAVAAYLETISVEIYRDYEDGNKPIPLAHVYAISNFLNIPPSLILEVFGR